MLFRNTFISVARVNVQVLVCITIARSVVLRDIRRSALLAGLWGEEKKKKDHFCPGWWFFPLGKCVGTSLHYLNSFQLEMSHMVASQLPSACADVILTHCKLFATVVIRKSNLRNRNNYTEKQESEITTLKSISSWLRFMSLCFLSNVLALGLESWGIGIVSSAKHKL